MAEEQLAHQDVMTGADVVIAARKALDLNPDFMPSGIVDHEDFGTTIITKGTTESTVVGEPSTPIPEMTMPITPPTTPMPETTIPQSTNN